MQAIVVEEFGAPENLRLKDIDIPHRGLNQILVEIHAVSVNPLDTVLRRGITMGAYTPILPYVPGFGVSGVVQESDSGMFSPGDRVWGTNRRGGGYAEYGVYEESDLQHLPDKLSYRQGAIIDTPFRTSFWSLFDLGEAKPGDIVIITGAAGSVGHACLQVAKAHDLEVLALCSRKDFDKVFAQGADQVFDYKDEELLSKVLNAMGNRRAAVFVDVAAVQNVKLASNVLAFGGRHIVVGPGGAPPMSIDPFVLLEKGLKVCGVALYTATKERHSAISKEITDGFGKGIFHVPEPECMPLRLAGEAHRMLESGRNVGKLVLVNDR